MKPQGRVLKGQGCLAKQLGLHFEDKRKQQMCFKQGRAWVNHVFRSNYSSRPAGDRLEFGQIQTDSGISRERVLEILPNPLLDACAKQGREITGSGMESRSGAGWQVPCTQVSGMPSSRSRLEQCQQEAPVLEGPQPSICSSGVDVPRVWVRKGFCPHCLEDRHPPP